jgi:lipopolysaccharide export system protein LptA
MPVSIPRLRRWFAIAAILITVVVAVVYWNARRRAGQALKELPQKMGIEIQQTAEGFSISKSEAGRTLFTIHASKAVQFKSGGHTELHDVSVVLYGRDSSRYDQISGSDFEYDPQSGNVTAQGEVQIDLEANPSGVLTADQAAPKELKNPIHLRTSDLVFNQKTGNAYTKEKVEFSVPQASGSAMGVSYAAKTNVLTLESQLHFIMTAENQAEITARRGIITKEPRQVVLEDPQMQRPTQKLSADRATLFLNASNTVDRVDAEGNIQLESKGPSDLSGRANQAELLLSGPRNTLRTATLTGNVHIESSGAQNMQGDAGKAILDFAAKNQVDKVHAEEGVKLSQRASNAGGNLSSGAAAQDVEIASAAMDFFVAGGKHLDRAETGGNPQITIVQAGTSQRTVVTSAKFVTKFGERNQLLSLKGAPSAKVVSSSSGQPDRVSTSDRLEVAFRSAGGIDSILQQGNFAYMDGDRKAWADSARYSPQDQMLVLSGSPRVTDTGMTTTAHSMRLNRATGEAVAEGDVKSTYNQLKPQAGGALLASSDPIHVTGRSMTARRSPGIATYTGNARLWQDANIIEAPSIQFDRDGRSVVAQGDGQPVSTVLVSVDKSGKSTPVTITCARLTYTDSQRQIRCEGGVTAKGSDMTITASTANAFLLSRDQAPSGGESASAPTQLDHIVAHGNVVIQQPNRRAAGQDLVYTVADEKFVLTGGPPSIFDAEHGEVSGDSLTFYKRDGRVLVEGRSSSPTVTTTRVAR